MQKENLMKKKKKKGFNPQKEHTHTERECEKLYSLLLCCFELPLLHVMLRELKNVGNVKCVCMCVCLSKRLSTEEFHRFTLK